LVEGEALGEHEIIKIIHKHLTPMPDMPIPFGDDVSATALPNSGTAILKTDMLVAKFKIGQIDVEYLERARNNFRTPQ